MNEISKETITLISAGIHQNVVYCNDGYMSSRTAIPPHSKDQLLSFIITIPDTDIHKKINEYLPKVV